MTATALDPVVASFKDAMAALPAGVTVVTTCDDAWRPWGFTASAITSLSMDPPLVLVCLAKTARCHPAFLGLDRWNIHILGEEHADLAYRFASRDADKFGGGEFNFSTGLPSLANVPVRVECRAYAKHDGGDHTILVGEIVDVEMSGATPVVYQNRKFHTIEGDPA
ncbi:NADH:riboflavin 5'-phosphate oxidoreductase [Nocardioides dokdonensis FR1436]|uniref:NADH:riboflavin 5'-phosphate oxidoreductase n=1 Tax=Nocardioides dokdonensis FR1436 TaxID=1300347 RepID=A0A1A9GMT8_9ACTN|nr:flavin reductase family protein [Nocardioides dokdonensis]ANH38982.1 NADH:riboflavin 5'-phosphate oxidoreductase [Nocardioides dokdonensis FR1436]